MRSRWVERISAALLIGLLLVFAINVVALADEGAPAGFCSGGVPWVVRDQPETLTDPICPSGIYILDIEDVRFHQVSFAEAELIRGGRDATYWFEVEVPTETPVPTATATPSATPEPTATATPVVTEQGRVYLPIVRRAPEFVTAPSGFCSGGVGWIVPTGSVPVDPLCGMGRYAVDRLGVRTWGSWSETVSLWDSSTQATLWFVPAAVSCSLGQETLCVGG